MRSRKTEKLAEKLAQHAIDCGYDSSISVMDSFVETLVDGFCDGNNLELDDTEASALDADLREFLEDMVVPEADQLIAEWNRDAREEYEEREEARRGQY